MSPEAFAAGALAVWLVRLEWARMRHRNVLANHAEILAIHEGRIRKCVQNPIWKDVEK